MIYERRLTERKVRFILFLSQTLCFTESKSILFTTILLIVLQLGRNSLSFSFIKYSHLPPNLHALKIDVSEAFRSENLAQNGYVILALTAMTARVHIMSCNYATALL